MAGEADPFVNLRACRYCGDLLGPTYGSVKPYPVGVIAGRVEAIADQLSGGDGRTYFECYNCEAKRRRRRIVLYSVLGGLILLALLLSALGAE